MDLYESPYFRVNKIALFVIGQWVYQTVKMKILTRILVLTSLTTAIIPQLRNLVKHMENDWNLLTSKIERSILQKGAVHGRRLTVLFAINMYGSALTFILMSLTPIVFDYFIPLNETRPRELVYAAKFPLDEEKYLPWLLVHGSITALYNLTVMFSCESIYKLNSAMMLSNKEKNYNIIDDTYYKQLTSCIKCHNHAIQYSKILNSCFSPLLFCSVGLNVIAISSLLIQTLNSINESTLAIKYGIFASAFMINLFCLTIPAQSLLDSSLLIAQGTYNSEWYNLPLHGQKLILPIILRGQIPSTLTVGKFCNMDMIAFAARSTD
ncbi:uncharacterized protein LOC122510093 [Leptopilina heterotoma]|uniref:uncharacterized protein LOC122510093 n=1 Tax=Leptopilina heterotoma TaxID=63436 RepID=UPI001CA89B19|nr:uncharacterized protein LOC122510093 [Leptopilina heterotoma]